MCVCVDCGASTVDLDTTAGGGEAAHSAGVWVLLLPPPPPVPPRHGVKTKKKKKRKQGAERYEMHNCRLFLVMLAQFFVLVAVFPEY
jgi:hypothetical protein